MIKYFLNKLFVFKRNKFEDNFQNKVQIKSYDLKLAISKAFKINKSINDWIGKNNICISIGENCNSSWYLKETGNKTVSFPFDWLFTSPEIIHDIIKDDFRAFLNKDLIIESRNKKSAGHKLYHSSIFNHKNPLKSENDFSYYQRAVFRFKKELTEKKEIIFVCNVINEKEKRKGWYLGFDKDYKVPLNQNLQTFDNLCNLILSINPNAKFIFIEQYTEGSLSIDIVHKSKSKLWIKFNSYGKNNGVRFINEYDDFIAKILYSGLNDFI